MIPNSQCWGWCGRQMKAGWGWRGDQMQICRQKAKSALGICVQSSDFLRASRVSNFGGTTQIRRFHAHAQSTFGFPLADLLQSQTLYNVIDIRRRQAAARE